MRKNLLAAVAAALIFLNYLPGGAHAAGQGDGGPARVSVSLAKLAFNASNAVQDAANSNNNSNNNVNENRNSSANNNNNTTANNNQNSSTATAQASASASATADSGGGDGGSSSVSVEGDDAAASGAAGVYITTSDDTCMGSSGVGGQGDAFGFSVGSTWTDSNCIMLKNARELKAQGHHKAAKARLCMDEDNAMAFELAGDPCPRQLPSTQAALAKIHAADPGYVAAAAPVPAAQLAALGDGQAMSGGYSGDEPAPSDTDSAAQDGTTLIAMAQSVAQSIAAAFASAAPLYDVSNPYPYDGVE